jgi:GH18 family chitinase
VALPGKTLTMAYYPDGRQEQLLARLGVADSVELMHAMSYDAGGAHHSTFELAEKTIDNAEAAGLPLSKVSVGLPFYGRKGNDWITYEDIVQRYKPLAPNVDSIDGISFNGRDMIRRKTQLAVRKGVSLMVWEAGQDCRVAAVTRNDQTHSVTCPDGPRDSLLRVIADTLGEETKEEL